MWNWLSALLYWSFLFLSQSHSQMWSISPGDKSSCLLHVDLLHDQVVIKIVFNLLYMSGFCKRCKNMQLSTIKVAFQNIIRIFKSITICLSINLLLFPSHCIRSFRAVIAIRYSILNQAINIWAIIVLQFSSPWRYNLGNWGGELSCFTDHLDFALLYCKHGARVKGLGGKKKKVFSLYCSTNYTLNFLSVFISKQMLHPNQK